MLFAISCGVPIDRTLSQGSPSRTERLGMSDYKIDIVLQAEDGKPIPEVEITALTPRGTDTSVTNSNGQALLTVTAARIDTIDVHFKSRDGKIDWSRSLVSFPRDEPRFRVVFKADRVGRVRMAQFEY